MGGAEEDEEVTHLFLYTLAANLYVVFSPLPTLEPAGQVSTASEVHPILECDGHQYPWSLSPDIPNVPGHFFSVGSTVDIAGADGVDEAAPLTHFLA